MREVGGGGVCVLVFYNEILCCTLYTTVDAELDSTLLCYTTFYTLLQCSLYYTILHKMHSLTHLHY